MVLREISIICGYKGKITYHYHRIVSQSTRALALSGVARMGNDIAVSVKTQSTCEEFSKIAVRGMRKSIRTPHARHAQVSVLLTKLRRLKVEGEKRRKNATLIVSPCGSSVKRIETQAGKEHV